MSEKFKNLYDAYNFGALQGTHPHQSALLRDALCSNDDDRRIIESNYVSFCSNMVPTLNFRLSGKRKSVISEKSHRPSRFGDILDFADDLTMTTAAALKRRLPEVPPAPQPQRISPVTTSNVAVVEEQRPSSAEGKRGPFTTAKQQYIAEVSPLSLFFMQDAYDAIGW